MFDAVVKSYTVGARKPEAAIYEAASASLGVPHDEIGFLDDFGQNLVAAAASGLADGGRHRRRHGPGRACATWWISPWTETSRLVNTERMTAIESEARSPGLSYQDLLDADTHPVPDVLRLESPRYLGSEDIPIERYTSRDWHRREVDRLWRRVWQFACREEHIPVAGDYIVYDIAELSFLVVRADRRHDQGLPERLPPPRAASSRTTTAAAPSSAARSTVSPGSSTASCRTSPPAGTSPTSTSGPTTSPARVQVDTWAGFVFINPDPDAGRWRSSSATSSSTSPVWDLGTATSRRTCRGSSRPTGRSRRRRSARPTT